ncbi:MAG: KEOPS complex subunit Pcc1 [Methanobacteriaceae archaeon]|jgi:KEOPS complex subunit Pcc1
MNAPERIKAEFKIKFENREDAEVVLKTIEVELKTAPSDRSSVTASLEEDTLYLTINAEDTHILRASLNSYFRWIILSYDIQKLKHIN